MLKSQVGAEADTESRKLLKTISALTRPRGFESHALRWTSENRLLPGLMPAGFTSRARRRLLPSAARVGGRRPAVQPDLIQQNPEAGPVNTWPRRWCLLVLVVEVRVRVTAPAEF